MRYRNNQINKFFHLAIEAFESENETIYDELGISKKEYLDNKLKMIKRFKLKSKAQLNKTRNENLLEVALQKVRNIIETSDKNAKQSLETLIHSRSPQFQFRNIEKLNEDDLRELLNDIDVIEIIEDLDKLDNANQ